MHTVRTSQQEQCRRCQLAVMADGVHSNMQLMCFTASQAKECLWVQAASKTNDTAGDGTTTATILSAAIIAEGMKIVAAGTNPVQLARGIERTVAALVKDLQQLSTDVRDADLANVATVSAGGNETVQHLILMPLCSVQVQHKQAVLMSTIPSSSSRLYHTLALHTCWHDVRA